MPFAKKGKNPIFATSFSKSSQRLIFVMPQIYEELAKRCRIQKFFAVYREFNLESHLFLLFGIIAVSYNGNSCYHILQLFPFFGCNAEFYRLQVLFQM